VSIDDVERLIGFVETDAFELHSLGMLEDERCESRPKLTGGRKFHLMVPIVALSVTTRPGGTAGDGHSSVRLRVG